MNRNEMENYIINHSSLYSWNELKTMSWEKLVETYKRYRDAE